MIIFILHLHYNIFNYTINFNYLTNCNRNCNHFNYVTKNYL